MQPGCNILYFPYVRTRFPINIPIVFIKRQVERLNGLGVSQLHFTCGIIDRASHRRKWYILGNVTCFFLTKLRPFHKLQKGQAYNNNAKNNKGSEEKYVHSVTEAPFVRKFILLIGMFFHPSYLFHDLMHTALRSPAAA
ncbi:hypothetical protein D3C76_1081090 [compost metagenome]